MSINDFYVTYKNSKHIKIKKIFIAIYMDVLKKEAFSLIALCSPAKV